MRLILLLLTRSEIRLILTYVTFRVKNKTNKQKDNWQNDASTEIMSHYSPAHVCGADCASGLLHLSSSSSALGGAPWLPSAPAPTPIAGRTLSDSGTRLSRLSLACCLRSATCAAMTRCRSMMRMHFSQVQSLNRQYRLWPLSHDNTPWFRHRAHLGVLWSGARGWDTGALM